MDRRSFLRGVAVSAPAIAISSGVALASLPDLLMPRSRFHDELQEALDTVSRHEAAYHESLLNLPGLGFGRAVRAGRKPVMPYDVFVSRQDDLKIGDSLGGGESVSKARMVRARFDDATRVMRVLCFEQAFRTLWAEMAHELKANVALVTGLPLLPIEWGDVVAKSVITDARTRVSFKVAECRNELRICAAWGVTPRPDGVPASWRAVLERVS